MANSQLLFGSGYYGVKTKMPFRVSKPSFQSLYIEMKAFGNILARGTSFVATSSTGVNFLITNRHNVTGRHHEAGELLCTKTGAVPDSLTVWHNASSGLGQFVPVEVLLFSWKLCKCS